MNRALIAMAIHDTPENGKFKYTEQVLGDLNKDGIFDDHDVYLINNGNCPETLEYLKDIAIFTQANVIFNETNVGTAKAINQGLINRKPNQHCIKMDNDVLINFNGWVEQMIEVIEREPRIGIVGLKRKDLIQTTWNEDPEYRSELIMLPHEPGQRWINVEKTRDIMGTCTMFNSKLLDKVGYMYQIGLYGFDDVFMSWRSQIAGFWNVHLSHIEIDHIDEGGTEYQKWKEKSSHQDFEETRKQINEMLQGQKNIYIPYEQ